MREVSTRSLSLASYNYQREISEVAGRTLAVWGGGEALDVEIYYHYIRGLYRKLVLPFLYSAVCGKGFASSPIQSGGQCWSLLILELKTEGKIARKEQCSRCTSHPKRFNRRTTGKGQGSKLYFQRLRFHKTEWTVIESKLSKNSPTITFRNTRALVSPPLDKSVQFICSR